MVYLLACTICQKFTNTISPITIQRVNYKSIVLNGFCEKCKNKKSKFLPADLRKLLPYDINFNISKKPYTDNIETYDGKIIPIFPMVDPYINQP